MGSKSPPGSNAFLRFSGSSLVDPMALSLSEVAGGLKFMAKVATKAKKNMIEKRADLILLKQHQRTQCIVLKVILVRLICQDSKSSFAYPSVPV